jgi:predicted adenine nucleotide alpha hydrolase (AANH) superfamily ATPase
MIKKTKIIFLLFWTFFVFFLIATPLPEYNGTIEKIYDKIAHLFMFGIFSFFVALLLHEKVFSGMKVFSWSFLLASAYSVFCEFVQAYVPGRDVSELDLMAGVIGAFIFSFLWFIWDFLRKPKLLLHICCVGCGVYVSKILKKQFRVILYYYNPNIYPQAEHDKRLEEAKKIAHKFNLKLISGEYKHKEWLRMVKGYEKEPEKGKRCLLCYKDRLEETARFARDNNFPYFSTTLTTSPHKLASEINRFGEELADEYGVKFLNRDFKKQDGFKKSSQLSKELGLYRQDYCGCEFSIR